MKHRADCVRSDLVFLCHACIHGKRQNLDIDEGPFRKTNVNNMAPVD